MKNKTITIIIVIALLLTSTGCGMLTATKPNQPDTADVPAVIDTAADKNANVTKDAPADNIAVESEAKPEESKEADESESPETDPVEAAEVEKEQPIECQPSGNKAPAASPEKPAVDKSGSDAKPKTCAHTYSKQVVSPTCTEAGYTIHKCMKCGETYTDNEVAALGHIPYCKEIAPNCTTPGKRLYTCTRCEKLIKTETFRNALGHSFAATSYETQPSCESCGTRTYACHRAGCTEKYTENFGKALGHDFSGAPSVTAATCTSPEKKVYYCSRCNKTKSESGAAALGHDYQAVNKTSTSVEWPHVYDVTTTGYVCSRCGTTDTSRPNSTNKSLHVYDVNAAMAYGNSYALGLGFYDVNYSFTLSNAAYFPYDVVKAASVAEFGGLEYFVRGQVSATGEMINSLFAPENISGAYVRAYVEYRPATDDYIVACLYG